MKDFWIPWGQLPTLLSASRMLSHLWSQSPLKTDAICFTALIKDNEFKGLVQELQLENDGTMPTLCTVSWQDSQAGCCTNIVLFLKIKLLSLKHVILGVINIYGSCTMTALRHTTPNNPGFRTKVQMYTHVPFVWMFSFLASGYVLHGEGSLHTWMWTLYPHT
jgi:hypothetical protein